MKVLVTYPNGETKKELDYLHKIILETRHSEQIANDESFLIIFGYENQFKWEGYIFKKDNWFQL